MEKWNEMDEFVYKSVIATIRFAQKRNDPKNECFYDMEIQWLKNIKRRMEA